MKITTVTKQEHANKKRSQSVNIFMVSFSNNLLVALPREMSPYNNSDILS